MWLGQLVWWTVGINAEATRIRLEDLKAFAAELDLDLPSMPQPAGAHAFRSAANKRVRRYTTPEGLQVELSTKVVTSTNEFIVRHVLKTTRDPRTQRLSTDKVAQLKFYRARRTAAGREGAESAKPSLHPELSGQDAREVLALIEDFREDYARRGQYLSTPAVRRVIRDFIVVRCNGLLVRPSGGVYFVENEYEPVLQRLAQLFARFGPEASYHWLPLIDDPVQRAMVADAAVTYLVGEATELAALADTKRLTPARQAAMLKAAPRVRQLRRHFAPYLALSEVGQRRVDAAMTIAERAQARSRGIVLVRE
jgi:hypothetical protein